MCQPLFEGPVDVVGDVHGECEALEQLLDVLGYREANGWKHPEGRRLVFVGDLVDRGPNSPGVVERVMALVEAGAAQCVLGNHELNILRGEEHKEGNGWFFGHVEPKFKTSVAATAEQRERFHAFFDAMPLALAREDLRVVHAAWNDATWRNVPAETTAVQWYQEAEKALKIRRRPHVARGGGAGARRLLPPGGGGGRRLAAAPTPRRAGRRAPCTEGPHHSGGWRGRLAGGHGRRSVRRSAPGAARANAQSGGAPVGANRGLHAGGQGGVIVVLRRSSASSASCRPVSPDDAVSQGVARSLYRPTQASEVRCIRLARGPVTGA